MVRAGGRRAGRADRPGEYRGCRSGDGQHRFSAARLVRPVGFDARKIIGVAHYPQHIVEATRHFDSLPEAVDDRHLVVGLTGKHLRVERNALPFQQAIQRLVDAALSGQQVAIVLGREDFGLSTTALDACHMVTTIPTNPAYPSLNLAQATLLVLYQLFQRAGGQGQAYRPPRHHAPPATAGLLEALFVDLERALDAIEFLRSRSRTHTLRSLRVALYRARLDVREASLLRAWSSKCAAFCAAKGVLAAEVGPVIRASQRRPLIGPPGTLSNRSSGLENRSAAARALLRRHPERRCGLTGCTDLTAAWCQTAPTGTLPTARHPTASRGANDIFTVEDSGGSRGNVSTSGSRSGHGRGPAPPPRPVLVGVEGS